MLICCSPNDSMTSRLAEVAVAIEHDAALDASPDLADIVLDPAQRGDLAFPDHPVAALDARRVVAQNLAVHHETASRRAALADREDLTDLGVAVDDLAEARPEQADQRLADVFHDVVDHVVVANVDALGLGGAAGAGLGPDVERDDDRLRDADASITSDSVDVARAGVRSP